MKKYFDFTLIGKRFLPIWLFFYILIIMPYTFILIKMRVTAQSESPNPLLLLMFLGIMIVGYIISFYIFKITIEQVKFNDKHLNFNGKFLTYIGKVLLGFLLSVITLFVYMAWFIKDITQFFVNRSSLDGEKFEFKGKGGTLFLIVLLTVVVPSTIFYTIMYPDMEFINQSFVYTLLFYGVIMILKIPYVYFVYKWMIDIKYKGYHIKWQTSFFKSCGKILVEILLIMITLGVYTPLAYLKLFKYFSEQTIAKKGFSSLKFGYELDAKNDFLFIWGQLLLTIVTLGIYFPWAYSKIGKRVLTKTYITEINAAQYN